MLAIFCAASLLQQPTGLTEQIKSGVPATLSLADVLKGMDAADARLNKLGSWEFIFKHARNFEYAEPDYLSSPYPDYTVVNAKMGTMLKLDRYDPAEDSHDNYVYRGGISVHQYRGIRTITPDINTMFHQFFLYPDGIMIDVMRGFKFLEPIRIEMAGTDSLSEGKFWMLPREIRYDVPLWKVRPETELVDGHSCHVLEYPGRDYVWVDPGCDFAVRRRVKLQAEGLPLVVWSNRDYERHGDIWLPNSQEKVLYNPAVFRHFKGKVRCTERNKLISFRYDCLDANYFTPTLFGKKGWVDDQVRGIAYMVYAPEDNPFVRTRDSYLGRNDLFDVGGGPISKSRLVSTIYTYLFQASRPRNLINSLLVVICVVNLFICGKWLATYIIGSFTTSSSASPHPPVAP